MCGILVSGGVDEPTFRRAFALVEHRGVRSRVEERDGVYFGHARLPIIGLGDEWDQPVALLGGLLGFVGEVLDFREHQSGKEMRCDLEMVRRAWVRRGPAGLKWFDGFWSIVYLDTRSDSVIHLVADYLCQKPLYYRSDAGAVGAASEPAAVAVLAPTTPDEVYLSAVVKWGYCPETRLTPYREVKKILPGEHVALYPREPGRVERATVDPIGPMVVSDLAALRAELEAAVKRRVLSSDVPVACLVSGGLDSAIVYRLAKEHGEVVPYYVDDGNAARAKSVVGDRGARVVGHLDNGTLRAKDAVSIMQEPIDLGSLGPQIALSDAVVESVCLTGDGADELFGGYGRSARYDSQASDVWHELVAWHLPRLDRVMMVNRVEVRSPFLARRVVEIALGLPRAERTDKKILKDLYRGELGTDIVDQEKRPLRAGRVERDREGWSRELVEAFRRQVWP